jgi:hypothetical protein
MEVMSFLRMLASLLTVSAAETDLGDCEFLKVTQNMGSYRRCKERLENQ